MDSFYPNLISNCFAGNFSKFQEPQTRIKLGWDALNAVGWSVLTWMVVRGKDRHLWRNRKHENVMHFSYNYITPVVMGNKRYKFCVNSIKPMTKISDIMLRQGNTAAVRAFYKGYRESDLICSFGEYTRDITNLVFHEVQPRFTQNLPQLTQDDYNSISVPHVLAIVKEKKGKYQKPIAVLTRLDHLQQIDKYERHEFLDEYPDNYFIDNRIPTLKQIYKRYQEEMQLHSKHHLLRTMNIKVPIDRLFIPLVQKNEIRRMREADSQRRIESLEKVKNHIDQEGQKYFSNEDANINLQQLMNVNNDLCSEGNLIQLLSSILKSPSELQAVAQKSVIHPLGFYKLVLLSNYNGWNLRLHVYPTDYCSMTEDYHSHRWDFSSKIIFGRLKMGVGVSTTKPSQKDAQPLNEYTYYRKPDNYDFKPAGRIYIETEAIYEFDKEQLYALPSNVLHRVYKVDRDWPGCITVMLTPPSNSNTCQLLAIDAHNPQEDVKQPLSVEDVTKALQTVVDRLRTKSQQPLTRKDITAN